ncbi:MAG: Tad domain-containing protein [Gemmatimonadetes bacterium]|nr:Tad domain-containing protein [Gemmatimonadota bacterium]NNM07455.1 Tad domain-containing protein [Gemmatimonadota bacterium]
MRTYAGRGLGDRKGQTLAITAVSMVVLLGMGALAVDLGMAYAAHAAAQRAADSGALAGASAFIDYDFTLPEASDSANARAMDYATSNDVLARPIEPEDVTVWVIPDSQKVRVHVSAKGLSTWLAKALGIFSMDVGAAAAAVASDGGSADECVLPFAMPDLWDDNDDDTSDPAGDNIPNGDEWWEFEEGDDYARYNGDDTCLYSGCNGTGLGSNLRDGDGIEADVGRRIWIKSGPKGQKDGDPYIEEGAGGQDVMIGPGNFLLWRMPDPDDDCEPKAGANWVRQNILGCNSCPIYVDTEYDIGEVYPSQPGNVASIKDELEQIMAMDPDATWDSGTQTVDSQYGDESPRVRIVPLWDPDMFDLQGASTFRFNNMAKIFIEGGGTDPNDFAVYARFMGFVESGGGGSETGTLIKYLRLVE